MLLRSDIDTTFKIILKVLSNMGVEAKYAMKKRIEGTHGSYWSISPDKLKKDIKIILNKFNDKINVSIEIGYGKYFILSFLSGFFVFIIGIVLYQSVRESLEYLHAFIANPFIVLFAKPPWLLNQLVDSLNLDLTSSSDLSMLEDTLNMLEYLSLFLIFAGLIGFLYAYFSYSSAVKFTNQLLEQIKVEYSMLQKSSTKAISVPPTKEEAPVPEKEVQGKGLIRCTKTSSRMIQCIAEDTSMDAVLKALSLFGFTLHEVDDDIYEGMKDGSIWATDITGYKLKARIARISSSEIIITIETSSLLNEFSDKDILKLNEFLNKII